MNDCALEQLLEADDAAPPEDPVSADAFLDKYLGGGYDQPKHPLDKKRWMRKAFGMVTLEAQKLAKHTYLCRYKLRGDEQYTYTVRYHLTDVLTCKPDGTVVVTTGGWETVTTKARINDYLLACLPNNTQRCPQIYQKNRQWYWSRRVRSQQGEESRIVNYFNDGDWFEPNGTLHCQGEPVVEAVAAEFDVESAACNYIEQEVGRFDWKANWTHHRQRPDVAAKIQAWLDHYEYGGTAEEVIRHIDDVMLRAEGRWL